jgi:hypothetical protein
MSIKPLFRHALFHGPSKRQDSNGRGAGFLQHLSALVHGSAGREDIVDQQDPLFLDLCGTDQTESTFHVFRTFRAREFHLRLRASEPHGVIVEQRYRETLADAVGQDQPG